MKIKQHDGVVKYLEDAVRKEYRHLINQNKAVLKTFWKYKLPIDDRRYLFGECDFVYMDFDIRSSYIIEVKHDCSEKNTEQAIHQIIKDMWATNKFFKWAFQKGHMAWYYPRYSGKELVRNIDSKTLSKHLNKHDKERIKEYKDFFDELLRIK